MTESARVLDFWFADATASPAAARARMGFWFNGGEAVDQAIRERFTTATAQAAQGALDAWRHAARPALALVILFDQFPRNLHRGTPAAFAQDERALTLTREALALGFDRMLAPIERAFLLVPYEHTEDLASQDEGLARIRAMVDAEPDAEWRALLAGFVEAAQEHRDTVARFGRFPHRNAVLGRASTPEEDNYLAGGGKTYGQKKT